MPGRRRSTRLQARAGAASARPRPRGAARLRRLRRRRLRARRDRAARRRARRRLRAGSTTSPPACRSDGELWRANVDADELDGYVEYRPARRGARPAPAASSRGCRASACPRARPSASRACSTTSRRACRARHRRRRLRAARQAPRPARDRGDEPRRRRPRGAREWQLAKLNLTMPEAQLAATGTWGDGARRARARRAARR